MNRLTFRPAGELTNFESVMKDNFANGMYEGLSREMLDLVIEKLEAFFGVNF